MTSGNDFAGLFGPPSTNLSGKPFVAVFEVDTSRGNVSSGPTIVPFGGMFVQLAGGSSPSDPFLGSPTPVIRATLSIDGSSPVQIVGGLQDRTVIRSFAPGNPNEYISSIFGPNGSLLQIFVRSFLDTYPLDLTQPGTYSSSPGAVTGDQFRIVNAQFSDSARGSLSAASVEVPEPSALAQLISGFAGIGLLGRLRGSAALPRRRD
ncbi:hypothetical protein K2X89_15880 [Myxococcota bacterium]|nr:hypothetical protein [Myxococcota bacterium]